MIAPRPGHWLIHLATAGGLVLTGRGVLGHLPPLPVALGCLGSYLGLIALGVARPRLGMWSPVQRPARDAPAVALALDAGPLPALTLEAAQHLRRADAHATFFVLGERAAAHPDVLRALLDQGHEIGVLGHSPDRWLSLRRPAAVRDALSRAVEAITKACDRRPDLLLPPGGLVTPALAQAASDLDLDLVAADVRVDARAKDQALDRSLPAVRGGAVLALTEGEATVAALPALLDAIAARGLRARSLAELLDGAAPPEITSSGSSG